METSEDSAERSCQALKNEKAFGGSSSERGKKQHFNWKVCFVVILLIWCIHVRVYIYTYNIHVYIIYMYILPLLHICMRVGYFLFFYFIHADARIYVDIHTYLNTFMPFVTS